MLLLLWTLGGCVQWEGGDADLDGISPADGDCNDLDESVGPGQPEIWYDGVDQNCDGNDGDQDGDGVLAVEAGGEDCWDDPTTLPEDFTIVPGQGFSQPSAVDVHPGVTEVWYDGVDGDCDGAGDFDQDGDGYDAASALNKDGETGEDCVDSAEELEALGVENPEGLTAADIQPGADPDSDACYDGINLDCDERTQAPENDTESWDSDFDCDQDGWMADQDCDDEDSQAVPDLTIEEIWYDCVDQNCDGNDGDQDEDGWISESYSEECPNWQDLHGGEQATVQVGDCWDGSTIIPEDFIALNGFPQPEASEIYPGATDASYDGVDADCAGDTDFDADGDGQATDAYADGEGGTGSDCDDSESTIYLGAPEYCDGIDRDCDGLIEDDDDALDATQYYLDEDDDGYGTSESRNYCEPMGDYRALNSKDCDDSDSATYPGADEYCDDEDRDCDSQIDEDHALDASTWYADSDDDGFGDPDVPDVECDQPTGTVADNTDCDDGDETVAPGASELCDGQLNDCDGSGVPLDETDDDGDFYVECTWDAGGWDGDSSVTGDEDCDDGDANSYPGGTETCDGTADEDCDDTVDEDGASDVVTWYSDDDKDGFGDPGDTEIDCDQPSGFVADDTDCDDGDGTVAPGASEICDGQLNDCDGSALPSDETDDDGDYYVECTWDVGGWDGDSSVTGDEDCDDGDGASHPGGTETCDGTADEDSDGDGYGDAGSTHDACSVPTGYASDDTDCDDSTSAVSPGAAEVCGDNIDQDCDGADDGCQSDLSTAVLVLTGESGGDGAGFQVDAGGDFTGDGGEDLLVGAYASARGGGADAGALFVAPGTLTGTQDLGTSSTAVLEGWDGGGRATYDLMGGGDQDGDGIADVLIGAYKADGDGEAYLVRGPVTGTFDLASADSTILSVSGNVRMGISVGFLAPQDGGNADAVAVGGDKYDDPGKNEGQVLVFDTLTASVDEGDALAVILGEQEESRLGFALDGTGDVNGDGVGDLILSAQYYAVDPDDEAGAAYVAYGPLSGSFDVGGAEEKTVGSTGSRLGQALDLGSDVDGDGLDDVLIGAFEDDGVFTDGGAAYLFTSALSGVATSTATAIITATASDQDIGWSVRLGGDVDGDGIGDVLVGAPRVDTSAGSNSGGAYLFYGPLSGTYTLDDASYGWDGTDNGGRAGTSVAFVPDVDGDGNDEVLVGAELDDTAAANAGAAFLLLSTSL